MSTKRSSHPTKSSSKSGKNTTPTPAEQPSASEPIPYRPTEPTPTADAVREALTYIDDAIVTLTRVVSYIGHPGYVEPADAHEALAITFDDLRAAKINLGAGDRPAVEVQS